MLTNYGGEYPFKVTELYDVIGLDYCEYNEWIKDNLLDSFFPYKDYKEIIELSENTSEEDTRIEYLLTKRTAEELALLSRTAKGKVLRTWLLDLKDKVESNELLTMEQVYFLIDLVHAFKFVVHQKAIEESNKNRFIERYLDSQGRFDLSTLIREFHIFRNQALDFSLETIKERVSRYCDEEDRLISTSNKTKREMISIIDKYALIGNAAFDFMQSIDKPVEVSKNVGEMVKGLAIRMKPEIRERNVPDLYNEEEERLNPVIMREVNPFVDNIKLKDSIRKRLEE